MSTYDLSRCYIDITLIPNRTRIIEQHIELAAYPEFKDISDEELRIAFLISDIESPFIKIKEPQMRLIALFEFLDIGLKTPTKKELFKQVLDYKHPRIFLACSRVIQLINNHDYAIWWTLNMAFYDLQKESSTPKGSTESTKSYVDTKTSITNQMSTIGEKLKTLEGRLFGDTKMKQAMIDQELKKISYYPEQMAQTFPGFSAS